MDADNDIRCDLSEMSANIIMLQSLIMFLPDFLTLQFQVEIEKSQKLYWEKNKQVSNFEKKKKIKTILYKT